MGDNQCNIDEYCNSKQKICFTKVDLNQPGCDQDSYNSCKQKNAYCGWYNDTPYCLPRQTKLNYQCMNDSAIQKKSGDDIRKEQKLWWIFLVDQM